MTDPTRLLSTSDLPAPHHDRWFEDYETGAVVEYGYVSLTEEDIIAFASAYDAQAIHTDPQWAATGPFAGLIASGVQTMAVANRLFVGHYLSAVASLASPGLDEVRWSRPVRPGDRLSVRVTVASTRLSQSKPDRGLVALRRSRCGTSATRWRCRTPRSTSWRGAPAPEETSVMRKQQQDPVVARNRKARHDYHIEATWEAGMVLQGSEVKALRAGRASLVDGFADIDGGEIWLHGVHIPQYEQATWTNHAARRKRKLLLHRAEIDKIERRVNESGLTIVPLSLYFKDGRAKIEIALARGKKTWDKRQALAERQATREVEQAVGRRLKGMSD